MLSKLKSKLKYKESPIDKLNTGLILFFLLLLPFFAIINPLFDNDTFTLLNTGKYIINHGFPHLEPFTIHNNLHFIIEQWLTSVIFYELYSHIGLIALYLLAIAIFYAIGLTIYLICIKTSENNKYLSFTIALFSCLFLSMFVVLRPQLFSLLIFVLEIFILECYVKDYKKAILLILPILSLILINLHSALWIFFFVLLIPYLIDSFKFKIFSIKGQGYPRKGLLLIFFASIAAGLANPYSIDCMTYLFKSYGNAGMNFIQEVGSPDFKSRLGIIVFIIYCILILSYLIYRKGDSRVRYILITFGTAYLGLSSVRNLLLFIGLSYPFLAYYYRNFSLPVLPDQKEKNKSKMLKTLLIIFALFLMVFIKVNVYKNNFNLDNVPVNAVKYIKANLNTDKIRLYNNFDSGAYLEFEGIRTFIDPRAEVFFKSVNKKEDIMKDYIDLISGKFYYKDFIEKYGFTHFLVEKEELLDTYLSKDKDFVKLYTDSKFTLFVKKLK